MAKNIHKETEAPAKPKKKKRNGPRYFRNCRCIECNGYRTIPGKLCAYCRDLARTGQLNKVSHSD